MSLMIDDKAVSSAISLRPTTPEDTSFLLELFAGTREEFKMLILDESQLNALISMQFNYQMQQYRDGYPNARDNIVLLGREPIGRMFVDESEQVITLIDVALLAECRGKGIGRQLLDDLLKRAALVAKPVRLHVLKTNRARNLYERLGFRAVSEDSMYYEMICEPQQCESDL